MVVEAPKLDFIFEEINNLKAQLQHLEGEDDGKYKELRGILEVQELNLQGMNDTLAKVINIQLLPRLKKVEEQLAPQVQERQTETVKKQVLK